MLFAIILYFRVRSMVAWTSFSETLLSNTGRAIFPASSGFNPAHFTIAARLASGSAWIASIPRLIARTNAWAVFRFFAIHFSEANQLAIRNFGSTAPQG